MTPRILLTAAASGAGKTTVTCALLQMLINRGYKPMACKSGPDYIDPMFHSRIIGAKSGNLDLFFHDVPTVRYLLEHNSIGCDITVLEGAMGFYDGIGLSSDASAYALARATQTPVVLVLDGRGSSLSLCAVVEGLKHFLPESGVKGVILNRVSPMFYPRLKGLLEERCGVKVYGYLPNLPGCSLESRHLGLVTPEDVKDLRDKLEQLAAAGEKGLDLEGLLALARTAPTLYAPPPPMPSPVKGKPVIAIARDEAFCFYYKDDLRLMEELGATFRFFSPLRDGKLPPCDGLYLGGGYPELWAQTLSENNTMRRQIRRRIGEGLPTVAECGGFLYLQDQLTDEEGHSWPMARVLPGKGYGTKRLSRFGYVTLTARWDNLLCQKGEQLRGHEFHYWDSDQPGFSFRAEKPQSDRGWDCVWATEYLYAGFPHLSFYATPSIAANFLEAAVHKRNLR